MGDNQRQAERREDRHHHSTTDQMQVEDKACIGNLRHKRANANDCNSPECHHLKFHGFPAMEPDRQEQDQQQSQQLYQFAHWHRVQKEMRRIEIPEEFRIGKIKRCGQFGIIDDVQKWRKQEDQADGAADKAIA